jgi:hypothetical protein
MLIAVCGCVDPSPSPTTQPLPTGSTVDLSAIVVTSANVPSRLAVYRTLTGIEALDASDTAPVGSPGFADAILTEFDADDDHEGEHEDRYRTFVAVFDTVDHAQQAFRAAVDNSESPDAWGLTRLSIRDRPSGDQRVHFATGEDYGYPELSVYLWRIDTILLQAVDFHPYDRPGLLLFIAQGMSTRAGAE